MKKTTLVLISIVIILATLCGCGTNSNGADTTSDIKSDISSEINSGLDISTFKEVEPDSKNINIYREEVLSRTENADEDEWFISDKDLNAIQVYWDSGKVISETNCSIVSFDKSYKETSVYYFPVVFRDENSLIMWYTTDSGSVLLQKLSGNWNGSNYVGEAHTDGDGIPLSNDQGAKLLYNQETGKVDYWSFGEKYETTTVPKGGVFCGHSYFEGYIFRVGSDVYALRSGLYEDSKALECIAHNVKYVIDASYRYGSDPWSQPLFLMEDGSLKCYVNWEGPEDAAIDDSSHLCDLQFEGGYKK